MDEDLQSLTREQLIEEVRRLRAGIREHRDSTGHELCWHHPKLWGLLPEATDPQPIVPAWPQLPGHPPAIAGPAKRTGLGLAGERSLSVSSSSRAHHSGDLESRTARWTDQIDS